MRDADSFLALALLWLFILREGLASGQSLREQNEVLFGRAAATSMASPKNKCIPSAEFFPASGYMVRGTRP